MTSRRTTIKRLIGLVIILQITLTCTKTNKSITSSTSVFYKNKKNFEPTSTSTTVMPTTKKESVDRFIPSRILTYASKKTKSVGPATILTTSMPTTKKESIDRFALLRILTRTNKKAKNVGPAITTYTKISAVTTRSYLYSTKKQLITSTIKRHSTKTKEKLPKLRKIARNSKKDEEVCSCDHNSVNRGDSEFNDIFKTFWPYDKIERYLKYIAETYPFRTKLEKLGETFEGRTLYSMHIGIGLEGNNVVFIDGGMSARDWTSIMLALYIIYVLTECHAYEKIAFIDWVIMPVVNPDGYAYSYKKPEFRMWNKNRSPCVNYTVIPPVICRGLGGCGVDIQKNFPYFFVPGVGSSQNDCSSFFGGSSPVSEKETNITVENLLSFKKQIKLYIGLHSYGALLLYPHAYNDKDCENKKELIDLAKIAIKIMNKHIHNETEQYTYGSYIRKIVSVAGTVLDYVKSQLNIRYTYFLHLRGIYNTHSSDIMPIVTESFYGVCTMAREVYFKFPASKRFLRKWKGFRRRRRNLSNNRHPLSYCVTMIICIFLIVLV